MREATWDAVPERAEELHARTSAEDGAQRSLVEKLRAGQAGALEELYVVYKKPIFGFLVRLARDKHIAEDLFQNTWLNVSRSAGRLRDDTELKAWLFAIARNEFRSYRRWQLIDVSRVFLFHRNREEQARDAVETDEGGALAGVERGLALLGASDREVLLLVGVEGMDAQQAATVLGISHAALRQRLGRARARLKDILSRLESGAAAEKDALGRKK
jgi:RNA polymerase sigma-70 factor, ECF subfamily